MAGKMDFKKMLSEAKKKGPMMPKAAQEDDMLSDEMPEIEISIEGEGEELAQGAGEEQDAEIPEVNQPVPQALMDFLKKNGMGAEELKMALAKLEEPEAEEMDLG